MRMFFLAAALSLGFGPAVLSAQTESAPTAQVKPAPTRLGTLVGCVASAIPGQYTMVDPKEGTTYRLSGTDISKYVGQRVQVTRDSSKRLKIAGGLVPSANAAAQAGAVDPTPAAAMPQAPGGGYAAAEEFRVKSVKAVPGNCP